MQDPRIRAGAKIGLRSSGYRGIGIYIGSRLDNVTVVATGIRAPAPRAWEGSYGAIEASARPIT